ncbi:hypothetical protein [Sphingomonas nostoxanthinifaciens]|uniref:hypothetical protein n=1 Tax=Sphingomonas nostoxanthinifaciens TaxID=2872652 RepID=UPI001CC1ED43|nr:hypothetical protein [Sphingomonas nostoxanthinifaciens]UAK25864.1 hypothetical protein K8P63_07010 [Sphingomonas nostoxanthinifaciens]
MADKKTKSAFIVTSFKDTNFDHTDVERHFTAGKVEQLPEGVFANYEHAGLVREPTQTELSATAGEAATDEHAV